MSDAGLGELERAIDDFKNLIGRALAAARAAPYKDRVDKAGRPSQSRADASRAPKPELSAPSGGVGLRRKKTRPKAR